MSPRRSTTSCLGLVLALSACGGCDASGPGAAPPEPASSSVAASSSTSGDADAASDAAQRPPFRGGSLLEAVPAHCEVYVNDAPAELPALSWIPCEDVVAGCSDLAVDWTTPDEAERFHINFRGGITSVGPTLVMNRLLGGSLDGWAESLVTRLDGSAIGALRYVRGEGAPCIASLSGVGLARTVTGVFDHTAYPSTEYQVELPHDGSVPRVFGVLPADFLQGNFGETRSVGDDFTAISLAPGAIVLTVPYDGRAWTVLAKYSAQQPWLPTTPIVVGSDVLFWAREDAGAREHIWRASSATAEPLIDMPGLEIFGVATDGETIVWLEGTPPKSESPEFTAVSLWASPFATSAAGLSPYKVADLAEELWNTHTRFESGTVVLRSSAWNRNYLVSLDAHAYRVVDAPPNMWWGDTMVVTTDELVAPIQPAQKLLETRTIRRVSLASLAPAQPIAGLLGDP